LNKFWTSAVIVAVLVIGASLMNGRFPTHSTEDVTSGRAGPSKTDPTDRTPRGEETSEPEGLGRTMVSLRRQLRAERAAREKLARRIEKLEDALDPLEKAPPPEIPEQNRSEVVPAEKKTVPPSFDESALQKIGLDPDQIRWLHERSDQFELDRLDLIDRATREGWVRTPRYAQALREENAELREELDDDGYDRMLYALGRKNRVRVADVLSHSPAEQAGIEDGDLIVYYDGDRIFNVFDLRRQTTTGRKGDSVTVEVIRDGRWVQVSVPRGPLGVRTEAVNRPPIEPR